MPIEILFGMVKSGIRVLANNNRLRFIESKNSDHWIVLTMLYLFILFIQVSHHNMT